MSCIDVEKPFNQVGRRGGKMRRDSMLQGKREGKKKEKRERERKIKKGLTHEMVLI